MVQLSFQIKWFTFVRISDQESIGTGMDYI